MHTADLALLQSFVPDVRIISSSDYRLIAFSKKESLLYHEWFEDAKDIDDDIFKSESLLLFKLLEEYRPTFFLVNDKKRKVSISPEINEFLVVNFQPIYTHPSMKKVALLSNEKLSIQGQAESTMEEIDKTPEPSGAMFNFFIDVSQAMEWLRRDQLK